MNVPESTKNLVKLIELEAEDLLKCTNEHLKVREKITWSYKPLPEQGYDSTTGYQGLPQSATSSAIERKIITLREHLNDLRKAVM